MNKKIVFIADFFAKEVLGGGELSNDVLISLLRNSNYEVIEINSMRVTPEFLTKNKEAFYIVSNFCGLHWDFREWLIDNAEYCIYEHDHKYAPYPYNPALFKNFIIPSAELMNYHFYKSAKRVFCQSAYHKQIVQKNLKMDNIVSIGGNLWSAESLEKFREFSKKKKKKACSIMDTDLIHKNTAKAIQYCKSQNIEFDLVMDRDYISFLDKLSNNESFAFFPKTPETLSRVICEARMMGMSIKTNGLVGATKEDWFAKKGSDLIDYMYEKRQEVLKIVTDLIEEKAKKKNKKLVSIISTFHEGEKFLEGFLENMVEQTIFDKCELILVDSASKGTERETVEKYTKKYDNIIYLRVDELLKPTPCLNMAIKEADGKYITFGFIDDRKRKDCLEILYEEIEEHGVDLVYGDVAQSKIPNETYEENDLSVLFEHSTHEFSHENMVKCLPGPMPLWKKYIHDHCSLFDDDNHNYADDWAMWLKAVERGRKFKKVNKVVGVYLEGGRSQQENNVEQRKEEAQLFFTHATLFGYNYNKYEPYFRQFRQG
jgi:glycosyltransferase involved in cell wall biosynthesis